MGQYLNTLNRHTKDRQKQKVYIFFAKNPLCYIYKHTRNWEPRASIWWFSEIWKHKTQWFCEGGKMSGKIYLRYHKYYFGICGLVEMHFWTKIFKYCGTNWSNLQKTPIYLLIHGDFSMGHYNKLWLSLGAVWKIEKNALKDGLPAWMFDRGLYNKIKAGTLDNNFHV
ncbi:hypothetical protein ACJX0J_025356, partial [Zea mays]